MLTRAIVDGLNSFLHIGRPSSKTRKSRGELMRREHVQKLWAHPGRFGDLASA